VCTGTTGRCRYREEKKIMKKRKRKRKKKNRVYIFMNVFPIAS